MDSHRPHKLYKVWFLIEIDIRTAHNTFSSRSGSRTDGTLFFISVDTGSDTIILHCGNTRVFVINLVGIDRGRSQHRRCSLPYMQGIINGISITQIREMRFLGGTPLDVLSNRKTRFTDLEWMEPCIGLSSNFASCSFISFMPAESQSQYTSQDRWLIFRKSEKYFH